MAVSRQRIFQQTGQVDTQWEIIGSPGPLPSSEVVNEFDTADSLIVDAANAAPGNSWNEGQHNEAGNPVWLQTQDVDTEWEIAGGQTGDLPSSSVAESYTNWTNLT